MITGTIPPRFIESHPPSGSCKVKNIYWDAEVDKVAIEYENKPVLQKEVKDGYCEDVS